MSKEIVHSQINDDIQQYRKIRWTKQQEDVGRRVLKTEVRRKGEGSEGDRRGGWVMRGAEWGGRSEGGHAGGWSREGGHWGPGEVES